MRPDTLYKINTNETAQLDFMPRQILTQKLTRSFGSLLMLQLIVTTIIVAIAISPMSPQFRRDHETQLVERTAQALATTHPQRPGRLGDGLLRQLQFTDDFAFAATPDSATTMRAPNPLADEVLSMGE